MKHGASRPWPASTQSVDITEGQSGIGDGEPSCLKAGADGWLINGACHFCDTDSYDADVL
jgi:hypothetical protein